MEYPREEGRCYRGGIAGSDDHFVTVTEYGVEKYSVEGELLSLTEYLEEDAGKFFLVILEGIQFAGEVTYDWLERIEYNPPNLRFVFANKGEIVEMVVE